MRNRRMNFGGVFLTKRTAVLGVILLLVTHHALSGIGGSESAVAGAGSFKTLPYTAPSQTVSRPVGNKAKEDSSEQVSLWQTIRMRVTAYCPCQRCCGAYSDGVTATGHKIRQGDTFIAADRKYSFGTEMIVPGYNKSEPVEVLDRGGAVRGNQLDVFFNSHRQAKKWGVKYLPVKVRTTQLSLGRS